MDIQYEVIDEKQVGKDGSYRKMENDIAKQINEYLDKIIYFCESNHVYTLQSDYLHLYDFSFYQLTSNEILAICDILCQQLKEHNTYHNMKDGFYGTISYKNYSITTRIIFANEIKFVLSINKKETAL